MKFAFCNENYQDRPFEYQVRHAAETGYDGLELAPFTLAESAFDITSERRSELRKTAEQHGIELVGLHWLLLGPKGLYLTDPDAGVRKTTVEYLKELCRLCADLGGRTLVFGSPAQRNVKEGVSYEQAWAWAREGFREAADTAGERKVFLLMEALPAPECNFIRTVEEALRMVKDVDHPHFRMMVDVKSMSSEGKPLDGIIRSVGGLLEHVHANDANRRGPGFGDTDFRPVFTALKEIGFQGYVSVEVFDYSPDAETIARESLAYLKKTLDQVEKGQ